MSESIFFVVNPHSAGGRTGQLWPKTWEKIKNYFSYPVEYSICDGIGTGKTATIDAIKSKNYTTIVSVGGEGGNNEVINAIYETDPSVKVGFIRSGTANDYLTTINWPKSLDEQLQLIKDGHTKKASIVKVTGDSIRYSLNIAEVGVGANTAYMASIERRLTWIKGDIRYTLLALRAIRKWKNIPLTFSADDRVIEGNLSLMMSGFSVQSGGFKVLPHADPYGEKLAYATAMDFSKLRMIRVMRILKEGKHSEAMKGVYMGHANKITLDGDTPLIFVVDGEPFSYHSTKITVESIPHALNIIAKK